MLIPLDPQVGSLSQCLYLKTLEQPHQGSTLHDFLQITSSDPTGWFLHVIHLSAFSLCIVLVWHALKIFFFLRCDINKVINSQLMCSVCLSYVVVMPNKRQALVEYEDMNGSSTAVTYAADNQVYIAGHPAFINYSTSQKISRPGDSDDSRTVNNVLLFTIMNPIYPITTVSATICVITLPGTVLCTS